MRAARMLRIAAAAIAAMTMAAAPARANIGTEGPTFPGATAPTGEKPQSKLWFNDGTWWGVLFSSTTRDFEIFRYDAGHWTSTQTKVDLRNNTWADAKWDGTYLNVVSHGPAAASGTPDVAANNVRYSRYSYDPVAKQYIRDVSEVPLTNYGVKAAVIDEDSNGRLYVTWTHALKVWIDYTTTGPSAWAAPIVVPVKKLAQLPVDEISSVVHYNHAIGVMWSNEKTGAYYFASHDDSQQPTAGWRASTAFQGPEFSDDHLNVKALSNDAAGQVFAIVKTSLDRTIDPLQVLVVMDSRGQWSHYTVWNHGPVTAENTRAQIAIDLGRRELYAFSAAPCCAGGIVYMKKTSLDHPSFDAASLGTPILAGDGEHINNPTTSKQPLDSSTGLLVMASADNTHHYWHALLPLNGPDLTPPDTTITQGPAGETSETSAQIAFESSEQESSFSCTLDGVAYSPCSSPAALNALAPGQHTFSVAATDLAGNTDPTPATRTWTVSSTAALFADDFEGGDLSRWSTIGTGPAGSVGLETDSVAGGVGAARIGATSTAGSYAYLRKDLSPAPTSASIAFTERVDTQGASGGNVPLLRVYSPSGTRLLSLYRPNGSSNVVYVNHSGSFAPTAGRLPLGIFRHFEVQMTSAGDGASTLAVLVDGVEVYRTATASLGIAGLGRIQFGNDTKAQPFGVVVDDVEVR